MGGQLRLQISILCVLFSLSLQQTEPYIYLDDPPARGSLWRVGLSAIVNFDFKSLNCGGVQKLRSSNGQCGVCGDPSSAVNPKHATMGDVGKNYTTAQQSIPITVKVSTYREGFFEVRLCQNNNPNMVVTEECLDKHLLQLKEGMLETNRTRYQIPPFAGDLEYILNAEIPQGLVCTHCILQWRYIANTPSSSPSQIPEQYRNCADIAITDAPVGTTHGTGNSNPLSATNQATNTGPDILSQLGTGAVSNSDLLSALLFLADLPANETLAGPTPAPTNGSPGPANAVNPVPATQAGPLATTSPDSLVQQLLNFGILIPVTSTQPALVGSGAVAGSLKPNPTQPPIQNTATAASPVLPTSNAGVPNSKAPWTAEKVINTSGQPFLWYSPEISPTVAKPRVTNQTSVLNPPLNTTTPTPYVPTTNMLTPNNVLPDIRTTAGGSAVQKTVSIPVSAIEFIPEKIGGVVQPTSFNNAGGLAGSNTVNNKHPTSQSSQQPAQTGVASNIKVLSTSLPQPVTTNLGVSSTAIQYPTTAAAGPNTPVLNAVQSQAPVDPVAPAAANTGIGVPIAIDVPANGQPSPTSVYPNVVITAKPARQTTQNILLSLNQIAKVPSFNRRGGRLQIVGSTTQPKSPTLIVSTNPKDMGSMVSNLSNPNKTSTTVSQTTETKTKPDKHFVVTVYGVRVQVQSKAELRRFLKFLNGFSPSQRNGLLKVMRKNKLNKVSFTPILPTSESDAANNDIPRRMDFIESQSDRKLIQSLNGQTPFLQPVAAEVQTPTVIRQPTGTSSNTASLTNTNSAATMNTINLDNPSTSLNSLSSVTGQANQASRQSNNINLSQQRRTQAAQGGNGAPVNILDQLRRLERSQRYLLHRLQRFQREGRTAEATRMMESLQVLSSRREGLLTQVQSGQSQSLPPQGNRIQSGNSRPWPNNQGASQNSIVGVQNLNANLRNNNLLNRQQNLRQFQTSNSGNLNAPRRQRELNREISSGRQQAFGRPSNFGIQGTPPRFRSAGSLATRPGRRDLGGPVGGLSTRQRAQIQMMNRRRQRNNQFVRNRQSRPVRRIGTARRNRGGGAFRPSFVNRPGAGFRVG